jgi:hypothetical protein
VHCACVRSEESFGGDGGASQMWRWNKEMKEYFISSSQGG